MQHMEVIVRYVGDEDQVLFENNLSFGMLDVDSIPREERLDQLESDTLDKGHEIMRHMFLSQCRLVDQHLAEKRQHSDADCYVQFDGSDPLKIASRLGILQLPRQVCYCETCNQHFMPLNDWLPEHEGMITTNFPSTALISLMPNRNLSLSSIFPSLVTLTSALCKLQSS